MPSKVQLAVAGSGKTSSIALKIKEQATGTTSLALTYTKNGQNEITSRISNISGTNHETMGWFSFLTQHIVRPYLPAKFPGIHAHGLNFVEHDGQIPRNRSGWKYYFDDIHQPYNIRLSVLAKQVLDATNNASIRRIEAIYDHLYIDEVQDLTGNDLVVLERLMRSSINVFITGDVRQSVLATSRSDRLNTAYRGVHLVDWFREREADGICELTFAETSQRFNHAIARFSDLIHDPALDLPATTGLFAETSEHDGLFLIDDDHLESYTRLWKPTLLRVRISDRFLPEAEVINFGVSKGITRERVAILTTDPIRKWLANKNLLTDQSASGFYVASTRARYSVALVVPKADRLYSRLHDDFSGIIQLWSPNE